MKCEKYQNIISDYLDDNLSGHERLEFELHIEKCSDCARALGQTEAMLAQLNSLGSRKSPVDVWNGVRDAILNRNLRILPWYRVHIRQLLAAPALAASIVAYLLLTGPTQSPMAGDVITTPEYSNYVTAYSHAQREVPLSDPDLALVSAELEKASLTTSK